MTGPRVYRSPVSALEAAAEIERCAGAQFDPSLARWVASALRDGELAVSAPEAQPEAVAEPAAGGLAPLLSPS
jgi:HD-GYP domain-containing protein (c-di-GMP phosphodiesterase class II)